MTTVCESEKVGRLVAVPMLCPGNKTLWSLNLAACPALNLAFNCVFLFSLARTSIVTSKEVWMWWSVCMLWSREQQHINSMGTADQILWFGFVSSRLVGLTTTSQLNTGVCYVHKWIWMRVCVWGICISSFFPVLFALTGGSPLLMDGGSQYFPTFRLLGLLSCLQTSSV